MNNLDKLKKTASHLRFLRYAQKRLGDVGEIRLITATSDRYVSAQCIRNQIKSAKKLLKEGMEDLCALSA